MHFPGEFRNLFLLLRIEGALVDAVGDHRLAQLPPGQLVQHPALLAGVDHFAAVQLLKLLRQAAFLRQRFQLRKNAVVHLFRGIIIGKAGSHRNPVLRHPGRSRVPGKRFCQVNLPAVSKILK